MPGRKRPETGLNLAAALEKYSDPKEYAAVAEYDGRRTPILTPSGEEPPPDAAQFRQWRSACQALENAFESKLEAEELIGSGFAECSTFREIIDGDLFRFAVVDYERDRITGQGMVFKRVEIFEPGAPPRNIQTLPEWLEPKELEFEADAGFRHVTFRGEKLTLGKKAAKVVETLFKASETNNPWVEGRVLLEAASSNSEHLGELIRRKKMLIVSDGRGLYRLNTRR